MDIESQMERADVAGRGGRKKTLDETLNAWLEKVKNTMMVVASLIAAMTFQSGTNPPGGIWQDDNYLYGRNGAYMDPQGNVVSLPVDSENRRVLFPHRAGFSVWGTNDQAGYVEFCVFNTIAFISSLSVVFLLISGLPLRSRVFMWMLMVITWISIAATVLTYTVSVSAITPETESGSLSEGLQSITYSFYAWIGLTVVVFLAHVVRFLMPR